ncbi:MAG: ComF family protein [Fimbriimonadaceae bacterium]|nr:ComF family protein [Fimbriimonadaceae bacterium]
MNRPLLDLLRTGQSLMRWVYPDRCSLCNRLDRPPICPDCRAEMPPWEGGSPPLPQVDRLEACHMYEGRAAQAVRLLKYERRQALAAPMAREMAEAWRRLGAGPDALILPVPLHGSRRRVRGFNQSDLLAEALPGEPGRSLLRIRATPPQVELTAQERRVSLMGAFRASEAVQDREIVLVDDVVTTGGTVLACLEALKAAGARRILVLAYCCGRGSASVDEPLE